MKRMKIFLLQLSVAIIFFFLWEIGTTVPLFNGKPILPPFFFSTPIDIFKRIGLDFQSGKVWYHLWITLLETILAFAIGAGGGILLGFWFAQKKMLAAVFDPYIKAANALPRVVLAPIFALWFGLGIWSKVALGFTLVFFVVFFNVYQGVREVNPTILANARMIGMNERQLLRHVYLPSAMTWVFSSLHTSVGFAMVGAVVGEYLGASAGLGYLISQAEGVFDVTGVFSGMLILTIFVILIDILVSMIEKRLLIWRADPRGKQS
ncbi:ABC transporter permease [uncultured Bartonella sp.]|uniref:ABC transporter permease n=1 Tax=uncultured Bartonella sp. TaxID=104108 RepID=UPI0025FBAD05|nr:ABC transporter permease [uncultured Bartonella sp.]